jgi:hypothetical protein
MTKVVQSTATFCVIGAVIVYLPWLHISSELQGRIPTRGPLEDEAHPGWCQSCRYLWPAYSSSQKS